VLFEGTHAPSSSEISFKSVPAGYPFCHIDQKTSGRKNNATSQNRVIQLTEEKKKEVLKEVEVQQTEFGVKK